MPTTTPSHAEESLALIAEASADVEAAKLAWEAAKEGAAAKKGVWEEAVLRLQVVIRDATSPSLFNRPDEPEAWPDTVGAEANSEPAPRRRNKKGGNCG